MLEKALILAHKIETTAPDQPVILTVYEPTPCNAAELLPLSAQLQSGGVQLELLTGPLDPDDRHGVGSMLFTGRPDPTPTHR